MYLVQAPLQPPPIVRVPPVGPDLIDDTVEILSRAEIPARRSDFLAFVAEHLPSTIGAGSRERFARYLARPYVQGEEVDRSALLLLGSPLRDQAKRQLALVCLAEVEPALACFLDERLPDPTWRWFTPRRLRAWLAERRGKDDPTSASRLLAVLRSAGYLRPFDRAWVLEPPAPSASVLLYGLLRELRAPGQTTLSQIFESRVVARTLAPAGAVYRMLEWAAHFDLVRRGSGSEQVVWLPRSREQTVSRLVDIALPEPALL
ncbi:MAG: hypothetical protein RMM58_06655 [Chloroflexota bacterium]|nr:hypothetical protein [Dehalococcoidia bacterium]MDW8253541.1 hypothetical protein [Chloroflexota bacterium]